MTAKGGRFYVGDYQLKDNDWVEFTIDGVWAKTEVNCIDGEYYIDLFERRVSDNVYARVRK